MKKVVVWPGWETVDRPDYKEKFPPFPSIGLILVLTFGSPMVNHCLDADTSSTILFKKMVREDWWRGRGLQASERKKNPKRTWLSTGKPLTPQPSLWKRRKGSNPQPVHWTDFLYWRLHKRIVPPPAQGIVTISGLSLRRASFGRLFSFHCLPKGSLRKGNGRSVICFVKLRPFPPQAPTQPKIRKVPAVKVKRILVAQRIKVYEMVGPPVTIS